MRFIRIYRFIIPSLLAVACFICPAETAAEGVTILKLNGRTELLIDSDIKDGDSGFIELELSGSGRVLLSEGDKTAEFRFDAGTEAEKVQLYTSLTGISPEIITFAATDQKFDLHSARVVAIQSESSPLPADIGHIIFSDFTDSDESGWNVYSWNIIPEVLIFDTADYKVQARLFKRLAFFVEKPGFVGRLVPNEELEGRHGWNAHDYKPEDLADFFTKAEETGFTLNSEEMELRSLLLDQGIIIRAGSGYMAGRGAVLSVSRETEKSWRYRFLTHECLHGLFFTDTVYKSEIYGAFAELKPEEVEFWKRLLDYRRYDVENTYLLVNEFMAYSLQQPIDEVNDYFKGFLYKKMIAARPYEESFINEFNLNFPDSFTRAVTNLEDILYNHTGRIAGHLANLYPAGISRSFFDLFPSI